jgi:hypothetical protein
MITDRLFSPSPLLVAAAKARPACGVPTDAAKNSIFLVVTLSSNGCMRELGLEPQLYAAEFECGLVTKADDVDGSSQEEVLVIVGKQDENVTTFQEL